MERLLAHPVARQQQRTLPDVPDGEGEHAVEMVHAVFAPRLVCVHEDLGIGPRAKTMPQALETSAERQGSVDFPRQGGPQRGDLQIPSGNGRAPGRNPVPVQSSMPAFACKKKNLTRPTLSTAP